MSRCHLSLQCLNVRIERNNICCNRPVEIARSDTFHLYDEEFHFSYSLPDGTKHSQSGYFSQNGETEDIIRREVNAHNSSGYVMKGFWEYFGPDGNLYRTEFTADEMGYRPKIIKMKARMSRNLSLSKNKRKKYRSFKLNKKRKAGGKSRIKIWIH